MVGRAGIGLDNVDIAAATRRGVIVVNAPQSNILSAAEHTIALLLAQARNIPQAHAALKAGRWERSRWEGVELHGKTLGIIGLGRVGPWWPSGRSRSACALSPTTPTWRPRRARQMGAELVTLDDLVRQSDFVTVHLPKTPETVGLIGRRAPGRGQTGPAPGERRPGWDRRRGGAGRAISAGRIAGAALDVFATEPPGPSPLLDLDQVVVTPHLGASTREAQDKAGVAIAEQVVLALEGDLVPFAVNLPAAEADEVVRPFVPLAERLGRLFAPWPGNCRPCWRSSTRAARRPRHPPAHPGGPKGLFSAVVTEEPVSYVNAAQLATERGLEVRATTASSSHEYVNLVLRAGRRADRRRARLFGPGEPRIVLLDEHEIELPFAPWLLVVRNDNRVGMVALVTSALATAGINIIDLHLGRSADKHTAIMAISFDEPVPEAVIKQLRAAPGILDVMPLAEL